nr:hypothetical protein PDK3.091 [Rhodococcus sp. DK17]
MRDANADVLAPTAASRKYRPPRKSCGVDHIAAIGAGVGSTISSHRNTKKQVDNATRRKPNLYWLAAIGAHTAPNSVGPVDIFTRSTSEETSATPTTQVHQRGTALLDWSASHPFATRSA